MFFHPDIINPTGPHFYHYTKFFEGTVGYKSMGSLCPQLMAALSFVVTACPAM